MLFYWFQIVNDEDDSDEDDNDRGCNEMDSNSSKMVVDGPPSRSNLNPIDMPVDEPMPKLSAEAEDGWTVVGPRRNRGKRN